MPITSKMVGDRDSGHNGAPIRNGTWGINWYVIHDVTWSRKVKVVGPLSRKWLKIETRLQSSIYRKWHLGNQMVTWQKTSRDPDRSRSWHQYDGAHWYTL